MRSAGIHLTPNPSPFRRGEPEKCASFVIPTTGALATGGGTSDSFARAKPVPVPQSVLLRLPHGLALFQEGADAFLGVEALANRARHLQHDVVPCVERLGHASADRRLPRA